VPCKRIPFGLVIKVENFKADKIFEYRVIVPNLNLDIKVDIIVKVPNKMPLSLVNNKIEIALKMLWEVRVADWFG